MRTHTGPGRAYRKGLSLLELTKKFDTVEKAEAWVHSATLAERPSLPALRKPQRRYHRQPPADALPLPRLP